MRNIEHICTFGYDLVESPGGWGVYEINGKWSGFNGAKELYGKQIEQDRQNARWERMRLMRRDQTRRILDLRPRDIVPQYPNQTKKELAEALGKIQSQDAPTVYSMRLPRQLLSQTGDTLVMQAIADMVVQSLVGTKGIFSRASKNRAVAWLHRLSTKLPGSKIVYFPELDNQYYATKFQKPRPASERDEERRLLREKIGGELASYHPDLGGFLTLPSDRSFTRKYGLNFKCASELTSTLIAGRAGNDPHSSVVTLDDGEQNLFIDSNNVCTRKQLIDPSEVDVQLQHAELNRICDDKLAQKDLIPEQCQAPHMVWKGDHHAVLRFLSNAATIAASSNLCDIDQFPLVAVKSRYGGGGRRVDIFPLSKPYDIIQRLNSYSSGHALLELFIPSIGPRQRVMRLLDDVAFDQDGNHEVLFRTAYWRESPLTHAEAFGDLNRGFRVNYSSRASKAIPKPVTDRELQSASVVPEQVMATVSDMIRSKRLLIPAPGKVAA